MESRYINQEEYKENNRSKYSLAKKFKLGIASGLIGVVMSTGGCASLLGLDDIDLIQMAAYSGAGTIGRMVPGMGRPREFEEKIIRLGDKRYIYRRTPSEEVFIELRNNREYTFRGKRYIYRGTPSRGRLEEIEQSHQIIQVK